MSKTEEAINTLGPLASPETWLKLERAQTPYEVIWDERAYRALRYLIAEARKVEAAREICQKVPWNPLGQTILLLLSTPDAKTEVIK